MLSPWKIKKTLLCMLAALELTGLCGCVLHEEPKLTEDGELGVDPTKVSVEADINLDITLPGTDRETSPGNAYIHRFIIEAIDNSGMHTKRRVLYNDNMRATSFSEHVTMRLHSREYTLAVWSDYVSADNISLPLFYDADPESTGNMTVNGSYTANNEARDSFYGSMQLDLRGYASTKSAEVNADIDLIRTGGRYELIATDVEAFRRLMYEDKRSGDGLRIRVEYSDFLACGYNYHTGTRKKLTTGIAYERTFSTDFPENTREISLGYDYCFCAPDENLEIPVSITLLDGEGKVMTESNIFVPVKNGINSTVKGRFLTSTITDGIGIEPSYDGNIEIDLGSLAPDL